MSGATRGTGLPMPGKSDWKSSHSLTKPFSGGSPAMASEPVKKQRAVQGSPRIRPPSRFMSRVCVAWRTDPAPRNSSPLNAAWFSAW